VCFSPEVDVTAGVVVGAIGVEALRHVRRLRELPLAALPLLFGAHQLTEAFVWWGLEGKIAPSPGHTAVWAYMAFAFVVLPLLAATAVLLVEPDPGRRRIIGGFATVALIVSFAYLTAMLRGPISAAIDGRMVVYATGVAHSGVVAAVYIVATVGALLSSSHRRIAAFGRANLIAIPILMLISAQALTSLWCIWAATASVVIANHLRLGATDDGHETPLLQLLAVPRERIADWRSRI